MILNEVLLKYLEPDGTREVVIEDDGRVAYAYLLSGGKIVSDVWLYNVEENPQKVDWKDHSQMPFLNPDKYCLGEKSDRLYRDSQVTCIWSNDGVVIAVDKILCARMESGIKPGWSRQACLEGPLAKPMISSTGRKLDPFGGHPLEMKGLMRLQSEFGLALPSFLVSDLLLYPLTGLVFSLDDEQDESGLGAEFRWMSLDEMIDEATVVYPGISAIRQGFLPVGICLEGTGDPYFLRVKDGVLVRIPHDAVVNNELDVNRVEKVATSLKDLVEIAEITEASGVSD